LFKVVGRVLAPDKPRFGRIAPFDGCPIGDAGHSSPYFWLETEIIKFYIPNFNIIQQSCQIQNLFQKNYYRNNNNYFVRSIKYPKDSISPVEAKVAIPRVQPL